MYFFMLQNQIMLTNFTLLAPRALQTMLLDEHRSADVFPRLLHPASLAHPSEARPSSASLHTD